MTPPLSPAQLIAGRRLLRWSRERLAAKAKIRVYGIRRFENEGLICGPELFDAAKARDALELAGVEFITEEGGVPGVRLRKGAT